MKERDNGRAKKEGGGVPPLVHLQLKKLYYKVKILRFSLQFALFRI